MTEQALRELLESVRSGRESIDQALARLRSLPFEDLGFAKIDHHRGIRCGSPEVVYCQGKSAEQVVEIFTCRAQAGGNVLATRADADLFQAVARRHSAAEYHAAARAITLRQCDRVPNDGTIAIVSAGTSDQPVAEEARVTAEIMDQTTEAFYDVGVAGIHRLLTHVPALQQARVVIVVAGMEGALASVVGGLVDCPVIAVPTSVGYGSSFQGLAALLTMLNSCASGVTVVNIDNGFGAGYAAAVINRRTRSDQGLGGQERPRRPADA
jgi:hypothetical protein